MSVASRAQEQTRGRRQKARDVEELAALEEAQIEQRKRLQAAIKANFVVWAEAHGCLDEYGRLAWNEHTVRAGATEGFATLIYLAQGGDRPAAIWLAENLLGQPDLPYAEKIKRMDERTALGQIEQILGLHFTSEEEIDRALAAFASPPPPRMPGE